MTTRAESGRGILRGTATGIVCAALLSLLLLPGNPLDGASWLQMAAGFRNNFIEDQRYMMIVSGLGNTLLMTGGATLIGLFLGLLLSLFRVAYKAGARVGVLNQLANVYVTVIRGTPAVNQLLIWYFVIFASARNIDVIFVATLAFGVNSGAYVAEIFRAGIEAIDPGQTEAGRSLGLNYGQTMRRIILPQAFKHSLPVLINEFISLLKETSVAGFISAQELTRAAMNIQSITFEGTQPLMMSALIYLLIVILMTSLMSRVERRLKRSDR